MAETLDATTTHLPDSSVLTITPTPATATSKSDSAGQTLSLSHSCLPNPWTVKTSFPSGIMHTTSSDLLTLPSVPSTPKERLTQIWLTLYWYFHIPVSLPPAGGKPGAPREEWRVTLSCPGNESALYEAESAGLVFCESTLAVRKDTDGFFAMNKSFWQIPAEVFFPSTLGGLWAAYPHPPHFYANGGARHVHRPRPPAPGTTFYRRYIPSLHSILSFRVVDPQKDLELVHGWMNNPRVDAFWGEAGDLEKLGKFLKNGVESKHCFPVIGSWTDLSATDTANGKEGGEGSDEGQEQPFGYFEVYWVKEDRLGGYTETGEWDRGVHCLVGEERFRGAGRVGVWLSSLVHCKCSTDMMMMMGGTNDG